MKKILFITCFFTLLFVGCKQHSGKKTNNTLKQETFSKEIKSLENELYNGKADVIDFSKANKLVDKYIRYSELFPNDSNTPEYLFKASDISMNLNHPGKTISIYNTLINKYPKYKNIPTCYFLKAFVYDDQLKKFDKAKELYKLYLKKYPKGEFAKDAKMALKYLGKSPEELIKTFEAKKKKQN